MTAKFPTAATLVALVILMIGLLGGPAWAQYPPAPGEPTFVVTTPGATITIDGNNWGSARVTVVRRNGSRSVSPASSDRTVFSTTSSADGSGRLAAITLPADLEPGDYELVVEGTDTSGNEQTETQELAVQYARSLEREAADESTGGFTNLQLIAAIAAVGIGGVMIGRRRSA